MSTHPNTTNTQQTEQDMVKKLNSLSDELKKIDNNIDETGKLAREDLDSIDSRVDDSVKKLNDMHSDLDKTDKEAENEVDMLVMQNAEDVENK